MSPDQIDDMAEKAPDAPKSDEDVPAEEPASDADVYSAEEEEEVEQRLRDLGYL